MKLIKSKCAILALLIIISSACSRLSKDKNLKTKFNKVYNDWKEYSKEFNQKKTPIEYFIYNKYYARIILLGVPVLPFIVQKLRKGDYLLNYAFLNISRLTERDLEPFFLYAGKSSKIMTKIILRWWDVKRAKIKYRFEKRYNKFLETLKKSSFKIWSSDYRLWVLPIEYDPLLSMGIFILPNIMKKFKDVLNVKGIVDSEKAAILSHLFMKIINKHTSDMKRELRIKRKFVSERKVCLTWWEKYKNKWILKEVKTNK